MFKLDESLVKGKQNASAWELEFKKCCTFNSDEVTLKTF